MFRAAALLLLLVGTRLGAQVIETPVPFDSAGRIVALTPRVADRLRLAGPVWPVGGDYREARLYSVSTRDAFVLVVQLPGGALQRFALTAAERAALGSAIDAAMLASGRPSAEATADLVSEPAGIAFARHQTFLSAIAYGPLAASLTDDGISATALYVATTGLTFFTAYAASRRTPFTRAQSDLAGSLGLAAGTGAALVGYAATGAAERGVRASALASAVAGTVLGVVLGEHLSDAEVHSAALGIENGAVLGTTLAAAAGADSRSLALAATLVGAIGYPIGVRYPRRASYTITAGDAEATSTVSLVGAMAGSVLASGQEDSSPQRVAILLGSGYLLGTAVGDAAFARRFDLTQSQANILAVGASAGSLTGLLVPLLARAEAPEAYFGAATAGAALGMVAVASTFDASRVTTAGRRVGSADALRTPGRRRGIQISLTPAGLAGLAARTPGRHVLARLAF